MINTQKSNMGEISEQIYHKPQGPVKLGKISHIRVGDLQVFSFQFLWKVYSQLKYTGNAFWQRNEN